MEKKLFSFLFIISFISILLSTYTLIRVNSLQQQIQVLNNDNLQIVNEQDPLTIPSPESTINTDDNRINELLSKKTGIALEYDHNFDNNISRIFYTLSYSSSTKISHFHYANNSTNESVDCDFSTETFDELIGLLKKNKLHEYSYPVDNNGKIIYETVPRIVGVFDNKKGYIYIEEPENIDEIVGFFERLYQSAHE